MSLMCITNQMPDVRSCTIKDQHQIVCDGNAYQWQAEKEYFKLIPGKACTGCLPREARKGLLCWGCWESVEKAVGGYVTLAERLRGIDRAIMRDTGGIRTQSLGSIPIPPVQLMLDELWHYSRNRTWPTELWVSSPAGAMDAIRFARTFASTLRNHPTEELAHRVNRVRCIKCAQLTLVWHPASSHGADVTVKCSNTTCDGVLDQASFEKVALIEKPGVHVTVVPEGDWAEDARAFFAEDYDPIRPEHKNLDPMSTLLLVELRAIAEALEIPRYKYLRKSDLIAAIRTTQDPTTIEELVEDTA